MSTVVNPATARYTVVAPGMHVDGSGLGYILEPGFRVYAEIPGKRWVIFNNTPWGDHYILHDKPEEGVVAVYRPRSEDLIGRVYPFRSPGYAGRLQHALSARRLEAREDDWYVFNDTLSPATATVLDGELALEAQFGFPRSDVTVWFLKAGWAIQGTRTVTKVIDNSVVRVYTLTDDVRTYRLVYWVPTP